MPSKPDPDDFSSDPTRRPEWNGPAKDARTAALYLGKVLDGFRHLGRAIQRTIKSVDSNTEAVRDLIEKEHKTQVVLEAMRGELHRMGDAEKATSVQVEAMRSEAEIRHKRSIEELTESRSMKLLRWLASGMKFLLVLTQKPGGMSALLLVFLVLGNLLLLGVVVVLLLQSSGALESLLPLLSASRLSSPG